MCEACAAEILMAYVVDLLFPTPWERQTCCYADDDVTKILNVFCSPPIMMNEVHYGFKTCLYACGFDIELHANRFQYIGCRSISVFFGMPKLSSVRACTDCSHHARDWHQLVRAFFPVYLKHRWFYIPWCIQPYGLIARM